MKYREFLQAYGDTGFVLYSSTVRENRIDFHSRVIFWIKDGSSFSTRMELLFTRFFLDHLSTY